MACSTGSSSGVAGRLVDGRAIAFAVGTAAGLWMAGTVAAQTTRITFEASHNSTDWESDTIVASAGETLFFRMRVQLLGATALGLAGFTCQPTMSNWVAGTDVLRPFTAPGLNNAGVATSETAYDGRAVASTPSTNTGRIFPYGASGQGADSASGLLIGHESANETLWFAGANTLTMGDVPAIGAAFVQLPPELAGATFNPSVNADVFRFAAQLNNGINIKVLSMANISGNKVYWHTQADGLNALRVTNIEIGLMVVTVVPGPGGVAMVVVGGCLVGRRRRGGL